MISLLKPVLSYFLLNTSGYQTQLAHSDKNHFSLNEILKNDDFFNFLPILIIHILMILIQYLKHLLLIF